MKFKSMNQPIVKRSISLLFGSFATLLSFQAHAIDGNAKAVMRTIQVRVQVAQTPVFIFDLDETLIDSTVRRYLSYRDAIDEVCKSNPTAYALECEKAVALMPSDFSGRSNRYDDRTLFVTQKGISLPFFEILNQKAFRIYLSNRWIAESDSFIPGAFKFVKRLEAMGGTVFYASSRSIENQHNGTIDSLKRLGLIRTGEEWHVYLKPNSEKSLDFKRRAFFEIGEWAKKKGGEVVGVFENEPENMNAMIEFFPNAVPVFVKGAYLKPEPLKAAAIEIQDFWL